MTNRRTASAPAPKSYRAARAHERLLDLRAAPPERRRQALASWLEIATAAEVRRQWLGWFGRLPEFARPTATAWFPDRSPTGHATAYQAPSFGSARWSRGYSTREEAVAAARRRWRCDA